MRFSPGLLLLSLLAACAHLDQGEPILPGNPEDGDWVAFHTLTNDIMRQDFFYDRSRIRRDRARVVGRWKVLNIRDSDRSITMYVVDIDCLLGTLTEAGTVIIEADGRRRVVPQAQLLTDRPIHTGGAIDWFRRTFCRPSAASPKPPAAPRSGGRPRTGARRIR